MTDLRTAAQQALEALLTYEQYIQPLTNVFGGPRVPEEGSASAKVDAAITTLRAALAEPVQEPVRCPLCNYQYGHQIGCENNPVDIALSVAPPQRKPLTADETMSILNATAGQHWCDEAHLQRFRAAIERAHGIE